MQKVGNLDFMQKYKQSTFTGNSFQPDFNTPALPFYVVSTGISMIKKGNFYHQKGVIKPWLEIFWSVSGSGEVTLSGEQYRLNENDVFYYLPGEDHEQKALSKQWKLRWLCLYGTLAEMLLHSFRYPRRQTAREYPAELFRELETRMVRRELSDQRRACALVMELFARMGESDDQKFCTENTVRHCIELISANISDPQLSVSMLADRLNISGSTLSRIFTEKAGVSPGRFILNRRRALALKLLRNTDQRIADIAGQCGFCQTRTFARFIRRISGCGPRELRRQLTGKTSEDI